MFSVLGCLRFLYFRRQTVCISIISVVSPFALQYQRHQSVCAPVSVSSYCLCLQNQRGKLNLPRCDTGQIVRVLEVIFRTDAESQFHLYRTAADGCFEILCIHCG